MSLYNDESQSQTVPFEVIPELVSNPVAAEKFEQVRQVKRERERLEKLEDELRLELGAIIAVAGQKSVSFHDLIIVNVDGGMTKGKLTGAGLINAKAGEVSERELRAIALAAKDCDPQVLIDNGFPASLIESGREPGKQRAGSTQLKWVGGSGRGGKKRAEGSGGPVQ